MHELRATLSDERGAIFLLQTCDILGCIVQRHRPIPCEIHTFACRDVLRDAIESLCDFSVRTAFGVRPEGGEDLISAPPEQQVERFGEQLAECLAKDRVVSQGSNPSAELE